MKKEQAVSIARRVWRSDTADEFFQEEGDYLWEFASLVAQQEQNEIASWLIAGAGLEEMPDGPVKAYTQKLLSGLAAAIMIRGEDDEAGT